MWVFSLSTLVSVVGICQNGGNMTSYVYGHSPIIVLFLNVESWVHLQPAIVIWLRLSQSNYHYKFGFRRVHCADRSLHITIFCESFMTVNKRLGVCLFLANCFKKIFIAVLLIYNVVLVSGVWQSESVIHTNIYTLFIDFIFKSSFSFTAKLSRKYRVPIYPLAPHTCIASPLSSSHTRGVHLFHWWTYIDTSSPKVHSFH